MTALAAFDVIGIGENSIDIVYRLPELPSPGAKIPISERRISPGGQVATTMCACARLGLRASYIGAFGADENGARIRLELDRLGVHTGHAVTRDVPNRYAVILVHERTGERVVLWKRDAGLALRSSDVPPEAIASARLLHVDATDEECSMTAARVARAAGVTVTSDIDHVTRRTPELVRLVDVALLAEHVPEQLTGQEDVERALRTLRSRDSQWIGVTLGARGAMMLAGDRVYQAPAVPVKAADTTAAGDVFRAGFIHALLRGDAPGDILRFANAAAAAGCMREGAIDSVPSLQEVEALLR